MGGCVGSNLKNHEEEMVLGICKERKRLMKLVVEKRYVLADSHCRYFHSLHSVSAAIKLFVARHSTPSSQFLITFPPPQQPNCSATTTTITQENVITNPMFLQQKPSDREAAIPPPPPLSGSSDSSESADDEQVEKAIHHHQQPKQHYHHHQQQQQQEVVGYNFYMAAPAPPPMPSPEGEFGWDFFNPFFGVSNSEINPDEVLRMVKEEEGIPDLEDEEEVAREEEEDVNENLEVVKQVNDGGGDVGQSEQPLKGRELLDALKDIEDHFIRCYESGKDVSRFLEANKVHFTSGIEEIKENSTKLIRAITWHGSNMARSSSCKSLAASSSRSSLSWMEYKNDHLFDGYGGMASGSHSLTLGRLFAWEKKLYEEVKSGDTIRKLYEKKSSQLRRKDVRGIGARSLDKTRGAVKDSYSQILVTMRRVESISERIQKLVTEELQPQIIELLQGLAESWKIMLECHETQKMIIFEVKTYECPTYGKFCANSHRLATLQLEAEIQNWQESFHEYVSAQRSYVQALHGWLSKFMVPEVEFYSKGQSSIPPFRVNGPPLYTICHDWLSAMENLPDKAVSVAMRSLLKDIRGLWVKQGEEQEQKRRVDKLAKELDKKILAYKKAGTRVDEPKLLEYKLDSNVKREDDMQSQDEQQCFRRRLEMEKERHHSCMEETQRTTLNGFQTGFGFIFESLVQFTRTCFSMYNDLVTSSQNLGVDGDSSCVQGSRDKKDESDRRFVY